MSNYKHLGLETLILLCLVILVQVQIWCGISYTSTWGHHNIEEI